MPNLTRRDTLRLSAAAAGSLLLAPALAACTRDPGQPAPTDPGGPEDPDRALRAEIGRSEGWLDSLYLLAASELGTGTATATAATGIGLRHQAYRQAIDPDNLSTLPASALATATDEASIGSSPAPSRTGSSGATSSSAPTLPATPVEVLALLRSEEEKAAAERASQAVRAVDAELARVIVLAGAGCAGAAEQLGRVVP